MESKKVTGLMLVLLIVLTGVMSFFAGMKYQERQDTATFQLKIGREVQVDTKKGHIQAPFVDIEYDK